jgi:Flp pilus assembly protein TadG
MKAYKRLLHARTRTRRGAITILAAILSIIMLGMVAFSVDVGYVLSVKEELQRTADAAALAAVWDYGDRMSNGENYILSEQSARENAQNFATSNTVGNNGPTLDKNLSNSSSGDMVFGYVNDFYNPVMTTGTSSASNPYNAVRVKVRRDEGLNGAVPMFFGRVFGVDGTDLEAEATAALVRDVKGFSIPHNGGNIDLLPFALDLQTWNSWMGGSGTDNYRWDSAQKKITAGSDGWLEVNLYPQGTGSPGNRGTVDIGSSNNSTADIVRQILYGVSAADLAYHGGTLAFDQSGKLYLNGDTGISAGVKDDLAAIKGQPRIIPIFSAVHGPGNNAIYTIVKWMGIRIMDVKLTGPMSQKHVTIQAAPVVGPGVVPSTTTGSSSYVYSPVVLVK